MTRRSLVPTILLFLTVVSASAETHPHAVTRTEMMAWLAGGISNVRIRQLLADRGIGFSPSAADEKQLRAAGAERVLLTTLKQLHPAASSADEACLPTLAHIAELTNQKHFEAAETGLRELLRSHPEDANLHFDLGEILRQQEQWDDALDEFTESARLMPGFPETHDRLAYIFYRQDDSDSTIAEARTALSIDPKNAEAYRYLGLGLYSIGKYESALHAYEESLTART